MKYLFSLILVVSITLILVFCGNFGEKEEVGS